MMSCAYWPLVYLLWRNIYLNSLSVFKSDCLSFCSWGVRVLLCILHIGPFSDTWFAICFAFYVPSFNFIDNVFWCSVFNFDEIPFIYFYYFAFDVILKKPLSNQRSQRLTLTLPPVSFRILALNFTFLVLLAFYTQCQVRIQLHVDIQISKYHLLKKVFFTTELSWLLYQKPLTVNVVDGLFLDSQFCSLV